MKGKNKYIVPLLLAGITSTAGIVTTVNQQQQTIVHAETSAETLMAGAGLSMKSGFDDIYQLDDEIAMPEVTVTGLSNYTLKYTITRGSKTIATLSADEPFKPTYTGAYNVTIEAVAENIVVSKIEGLTIMVEKSDAVISLPSNSKYVIPAKIPTNQANFKIPAPTVEVLGDDGEEVDMPANGEVKVTLVTPSKTLDLELTEHATDPYYSAKSEDATTWLSEAGTYQIRYEYYEGNALITRLESNFQVVEDLDMSGTKLYMKLQSSVPSTGNVNTDISVPKVTVLDDATATDGINAHVTITYSRILDNGQLSEPTEIDYDTYTFCPREEGNYILSYKADLQELYGISTDAYKPSTIIKVTDNQAPTVRPVADYEVIHDDNDGSYTISTDGTTADGSVVTKDNSLELLANRKCDVPSVVIAGEPFSLPAIYGEDNFSDWEDITFIREIVGNSISKKSFVSTLDEDAQYPANEAITKENVGTENEKELVLNTPGNYEIRYIAKDAAGKQIRATYTLVVKEADDVTDAKTTVKMSIGVSSITDKETLTFNKPTASDTYDSAVEVITGYELYTAKPTTDSEVEDYRIDNSRQLLTETNSNDKYELNIAEVISGQSGANYIRIFTTAKVDNYRTDTETTVDKYIKVTRIYKDSDVAPTFKIVGATDVDVDAWNSALLQIEGNKAKTIKTTGGTDVISVDGIDKYGFALVDDANVSTSAGGVLAAFDQGKESIELPAVTFFDGDENLAIRLTITDSYGNQVTKDEYETIAKVESGDGWLYTISGASFKMSSAGVYTVTYRAQDIAGNVTVQSYGIRVNDKTAPTIVIEDEDKFGGDVEVGEFFEVPVGNLIKNGELLENRDVEWQVYGGPYERTSTGFTPLATGTYYVKYYGTDEMLNMQLLQDDSLFYINAKDTTAPVFNDDSTITISPTMAWNPDEDADEEEMKIYIPVVYATDPIRNEAVDVTCTVTDPKGNTVKIKSDIDDDDVDYFIATKQGKYTIEYVATDSSNNTVTMTKELALGDCVLPTISWDNEDKDIPSTVKLNDTFELKLGKLSASDNVTDEEYLLKNMTIKLVKPDGTTELTNLGTDGQNYKWKLTETGSYTLSIVVKDEAGMSNTYKYTIEVPSEDAEEKTVSPVVGTILVVVSVVILAGVVIYFVVSSRKKATAKVSRTRKKKD